MDANIELKIRRARAQLLLGQPFYGSLALHMDIQECPDIETTRCNGEVIQYNPKFIAELSDTETQGVIAQAVTSIALLHHTRRQHRDDKKWQKASDFATNPILKESGFTLPEGALDNPAYHNKSAEEIYSLLPDEPGGGDGEGNQGGQSGDDPGGMSAVQDAPGKTEADRQKAEQNAKMMAATSALAAKSVGKLPASMARLIDDILNPKLDWRTILRDFLETSAKNDYSWSRANRRYLAMGLYLPGMHSVEMGEIVIAVDTSGSIGTEELMEFAAEINSIMHDVKPDKVTLIYADAAVNRVDEFERGEDFAIKAVGGGGTDFNPAFDYVQKHGIEPRAFIYLTDLYGPFPAKPPSYPTLFIACAGSDVVAPFGQTVKLAA